MTATRRTRLSWQRAGAPIVVVALAFLAAGCGAGSGGGTTAATTSKVPTQKQNTYLNAKLPDAVRSAGVIKIGTEALYPPFESFGADNKTIVGLDPEMANALGQVLGVKVTITHTAFDGLLTALDGGRFDIVMAAITDTRARQAKYDCADYFTTGQANECAAKKIKVTALPNDKDALLQERTGRADANFTQDAVGRYNS